MSAHLDSRPSLPKIRVGINLRDAPRACSSGSAVILDDNSDRGHPVAEKEIIINSSSDEEEEEECRTPKSAEFKIPAILSFPPAPRKPKRPISCKRKLGPEFDFFDVVHREEIESFFRSGFQLAKRIRCPDPIPL